MDKQIILLSINLCIDQVKLFISVDDCILYDILDPRLYFGWLYI